MALGHRDHQDRRRIRRPARSAAAAERPVLRRYRQRDHRDRGAGGAVRPAPAVPQIPEMRAAGVGDPDLDLGIKVHAEGAGADRLVNTVAAHERYKGALIVVDFGTATTFDIVSENGDYEGGVIAPGANVSAEALH